MVGNFLRWSTEN